MNWYEILGTVAGVVTISGGAIWIANRLGSHPPPATEGTLRQIDTKLGRILEYLDGLPQATSKIKKTFTEGMEHKKKYEYDEAIKLFREALAQGTTGSQKVALLILIGNCFFEQARFAEAEGHYKEAAAAAKEAKDQAELATNYNNIGAIYQSKGDYDKALEYYQKSLKIKGQIGDQAGLAAIYNNIGLIYDSKGDYDKALEYYQKSLKITEQIGDQAGLATTYNNIGLICKSKGDYDKALNYAQRAFSIFEQIGAKDKAKQVKENIEAIKAQRQKVEKLLALPGKIEISDVTTELEENELGESPGGSST